MLWRGKNGNTYQCGRGILQCYQAYSFPRAWHLVPGFTGRIFFKKLLRDRVGKKKTEPQNPQKKIETHHLKVGFGVIYLKNQKSKKKIFSCSKTYVEKNYTI